MKNENKIDNYFDRVKQNPPLIPIEKVHQIINRPEATARLKDKHKNLLKIIIMTTIFAIIISAVLMWPGEDSKLQEKVSSIKTQDTRQAQGADPTLTVSDSKLQVTHKEQVSENFENDLTLAGNTNKKSSDDKNIAMAELNKGSSEIMANSSNVSVFEQIDKNSIATALPDEEMPIDFDIDTSQPIDGSKFVLKLSKEELEKIGFQIKDSLMLYENNWNGMGYRFGKSRKRVFGELTGYTGYYISGVEFAFEKTEKIHSAENGFSFYPVYKSSMFYSDLMSNGTLEPKYFESASDTLLPIVFPDFDDGKNEVLLWFVENNQLSEILSANHKPLLDEFIKLKSHKQKNPQKDFIVYRSPFLLDESKNLKLSEKELEKIGFSFYADSTVYNGKNSRCQLKVLLSEKESYIQSIQYDDLQIPELNKGSLALFMTDKNGIPLFNSLGLLPILFPEEGEIFNQIPLLIPVEVKVRGNYESLIFWFLPNENFFNSISEEVSNDLQAEYNYITAEDKSALVKPVCKYYEECKNTLELTDFKAYPNPASQRVTVSFELPETIGARISLVDLAGRERKILHPQTQFAAGPHHLEFDLSSVAEGIYFLTLYSDKGVQTHRLMVVL